MDLGFPSVILVDKSLRALCLSSKMVYQHLLYLLSLWIFKDYPRSDFVMYCKLSRTFFGLLDNRTICQEHLSFIIMVLLTRLERFLISFGFGFDE